jgi:hypothetical protein
LAAPRCFEERLGLLVEREASERDSRLLTARLRFPDAVPEDIDYRSSRGLERWRRKFGQVGRWKSWGLSRP